MLTDLRYALRGLRNRPGFTLVALLTLGVGIGATTAIYSVVHSVLLDPPDYREPGRLMRAYLSTNLGAARGPLNPRDLLDLSTAQSVEGIAFGNQPSETLTGVDDPRQVDVANVTANLFPLLGVQPAQGRWFSPDEQAVGADRVLVVSHARWRDLFGGDPAMVGRTLRLSGVPHTVIGVAPPGFEDPVARRPPDFWRPLVVDPENRGGHFVRAIVRLRSGVTPEQATTELNRLFAAIAESYDYKQGRTISLERITHAMVGEVRTTLVMLLAAVGVLLVIACVNVAGLLLARAIDRRREIAIRLGLGSGRLRVARELLVESLVLGMLGGALGALLAFWIVDALRPALVAMVPRADRVVVDTPVLLFALVVSVTTSVLFGLVPGVQVTHGDLGAALASGSRAGSGGPTRQRLRAGLVSGQVALSVILLVAGGLTARSFVNLIRVPPGFSHASASLSFQVSLPETAYPRAGDVRGFFTRFAAQLATQPGVEAVGAVNALPFTASMSCASFGIEGRNQPEERAFSCAEERFVRGDYLSALGIPVLRGRGFLPGDARDGLPVAIVNQTMVRTFWPGQDPLGQRVKWGSRDSEAPWATVVGVVSDVRHFGLQRDPVPELYMPEEQGFPVPEQMFVVRTSGDPTALTGAVRNVLRAMNPSLPLVDVRTMRQRIDASAGASRLSAGLFVTFGALALGLAALGLYGVLAYAVVQRTQEIGVRMALGAQRRDVMAHVGRQSLRMVAAGLGFGVPAALLIARLMRTQLFGVGAADPVALLGAISALSAAALAATYLPARRAAGVDPMTALRYE